jgi:putative aminopeptidase FrvX
MAQTLAGPAVMGETSGLMDILKSLIRSPAVVGAEHSFFRVLQRELEERGADVTWYEGLLVARSAEPGPVMLSAHIDRHGLVCTGPNEFQYAAFVSGGRSDLLGNSVSEELMLTIADRFDDMPVYGYEPWSGAYRGAGMIEHAYICEYRTNLIFEVRGLDHLVAGTPVAFRDSLSVNDGHMSAQLDNVLTVAILVHLFELGFRGTAFFTAQEEAGRSWRYLLEWFRRFGGASNEVLVLDTSPYPSQADADRQHVVLRHRDANAPFDQGFTARIEGLCREHGVAYDYKDAYIERLNAERLARGEEPRSLGSTELGRVIAASEGIVSGTTLQLPTAGYHTMNETVSIAACEAFIRLLRAYGEF